MAFATQASPDREHSPAIIAIWGGISWNSHKHAAFDQARSNVEVLREYALRVFETQQSLSPALA
jgi:hypothetical protein